MYLTAYIFFKTFLFFVNIKYGRKSVSRIPQKRQIEKGKKQK